MDNYSEQPAERLKEIQADLERQYAGYQARSLKLDMSRGKPSGSQLDLTNGILDLGICSTAQPSGSSSFI